MRTDAKFGVLFALVVGLVAGGYYTFRGSDEAPISLGVDRAVDASDRPATRPRPAFTKKVPTTVDRSGNVLGRKVTSGTPVDSNIAKNKQASAAPKQLAGLDASKTDPASSNASRGSGSLPLTGLTGGWSDPGSSDAGTSGKPELVGVTTPGGSSPKAISPKVAAPPRSTPMRDPLAPALRRSPAAGLRNETHTVQDGDTFSSLSMQYYGSERHIQDLIKANTHIANPNVLKIGTVLQIPPMGAAPSAKKSKVSKRPKTAKAPSASRTYVVQPGDSFYKIARDELGDAMRWQELFELNRSTVGDDPSSLATGAVLKLPAK